MRTGDSKKSYTSLSISMEESKDLDMSKSPHKSSQSISSPVGSIQHENIKANFSSVVHKEKPRLSIHHTFV